jgi:hypothetical protein
MAHGPPRIYQIPADSWCTGLLPGGAGGGGVGGGGGRAYYSHMDALRNIRNLSAADLDATALDLGYLEAGCLRDLTYVRVYASRGQCISATETHTTCKLPTSPLGPGKSFPSHRHRSEWPG